MLFKNPYVLYFLFALLIPVLVHLFQLRKFKKVPFTNVAFLVKALRTNRKSNTLKKWLILSLRLLSYAALILAFAQPYFPEEKNKAFTETVLYLDNSFSMEAKGSSGPLLQRAIQDILGIPNTYKLQGWITNNDVHTITSEAWKPRLQQIEYTHKTLDFSAILLKAERLFSKDATAKQLIYVSDFQDVSAISPDSLNKTTNGIKISPVVLKPQRIENFAIDSLKWHENTATIFISRTYGLQSTIAVSAYNGTRLLTKSTARFEGNTMQTQLEITFPDGQISKGKFLIEDEGLSYDNAFFFSLNSPEKITVWVVENTIQTHDFLTRIYAEDAFNLERYTLNNFPFSKTSEPQVIILNSLEAIPTSLISTLHTFQESGGSLIVLPSTTAQSNSYQALLSKYNIRWGSFLQASKKITQIVFEHPVFENVFDKRVTNFQYPTVNGFFEVDASYKQPILNFEGQQPFVFSVNNVFVFTTPLNNSQTNFTASPLVVPLFYQIAQKSFQRPALYYSIGSSATFSIPINLPQDHVLHLVNANNNLIPPQQQFADFVEISSTRIPDKPGNYAVVHQKDTLSWVSYNFSRKEALNFNDHKINSGVSTKNTLQETLQNTVGTKNIDGLWKWFLIFALLVLALEMSLLVKLK